MSIHVPHLNKADMLSQFLKLTPLSTLHNHTLKSLKEVDMLSQCWIFSPFRPYKTRRSTYECKGHARTVRKKTPSSTQQIVGHRKNVAVLSHCQKTDHLFPTKQCVQHLKTVDMLSHKNTPFPREEPSRAEQSRAEWRAAERNRARPKVANCARCRA